MAEDWKERYLQLWRKTTQRQRYLLFGLIAAVLVIIFAGSYFYGSKPDLVPLFTNMETKDAGEVAAKLDEAKIQYEIQENKQGVTILVPSKDVHSTRLDLATQGLPRGYKGFEIFDDSKLGVTEFQNKVNYLQALQGELTRTIEQVAAIDKARVHIVLPEDSLYKKNEKPATASIMLRMKPEKKLTKKEIKGIVNLAAHSVQGLTPENITIVDDTGKILNDPDEDEEHNVGNQTITQLEMTRKVQERMQKDVQTLLDQALGTGRAFVRVNVELDFDQRQTDRQVFTPVVEESGIIRSRQDMSETYTGTSNNPGGPAGVQANIPGYVAEEGNANAQYEKKESTQNYEINEEKSKIVASPGSIRRVNIAVLVNEDITRAQQDSIMRSVSSAVGINPERGDTVSVEPLPFTTTESDQRLAEQQAELMRRERIFYMEIAGLLFIVALAAGAFLMRRRKMQLEQEALEEAEREAQRLREIEEAKKREEERLAREEERRKREEEKLAREEAERMAREDEAKRNAILGIIEPEEEKRPEELTPEEKRHVKEREAIEKLINEKPADVALLVKTWLSEE